MTALTQFGLSGNNARDFLAYHAENMNIWKKYEAEALRLIDLGAKRLGSKMIFENLRTDPTLNTQAEFKVQNNYTPHYARVFALKYPQHADKFVFKKCK